MRLIDADELIKRIGKWMPKDPCGKEQTIEEVVATDIAVSVCMEIEETPTAFEDWKGIIVMDNPKNCGECRLFRHLTGFAQTCGYYNCNTDSQLKPSWCPIKPIRGRTEKSDG